MTEGGIKLGPWHRGGEDPSYAEVLNQCVLLQPLLPAFAWNTAEREMDRYYGCSSMMLQSYGWDDGPAGLVHAQLASPVRVQPQVVWAHEATAATVVHQPGLRAVIQDWTEVDSPTLSPIWPDAGATLVLLTYGGTDVAAAMSIELDGEVLFGPKLGPEVEVLSSYYWDPIRNELIYATVCGEQSDGDVRWQEIRVHWLGGSADGPVTVCSLPVGARRSSPPAVAVDTQGAAVLRPIWIRATADGDVLFVGSDGFVYRYRGSRETIPEVAPPPLEPAVQGPAGQ